MDLGPRWHAVEKDLPATHDGKLIDGTPFVVLTKLPPEDLDGDPRAGIRLSGSPCHLWKEDKPHVHFKTNEWNLVYATH